MSLQSDLELCLEYAEAVESKYEQRSQAQNSIIFMQNESERLKKKIFICTVLSALSVVMIAFFLLALGIAAFPAIVVFTAVLVVALFNRSKAKKESEEFEFQKPVLIKQYTSEAENCELEIVHLLKEIAGYDLFSIVPKDYFYTEAIEFCLGQVRKQLASTASEAFRQLDAEIKRLEQMELLEQMNDAQLERLDDIKRAIDLNTFITLMEHENRK